MSAPRTWQKKNRMVSRTNRFCAAACQLDVPEPTQRNEIAGRGSDGPTTAEKNEASHRQAREALRRMSRGRH